MQHNYVLILNILPLLKQVLQQTGKHKLLNIYKPEVTPRSRDQNVKVGTSNGVINNV